MRKYFILSVCLISAAHGGNKISSARKASAENNLYPDHNYAAFKKEILAMQVTGDDPQLRGLRSIFKIGINDDGYVENLGVIVNYCHFMPTPLMTQLLDDAPKYHNILVRRLGGWVSEEAIDNALILCREKEYNETVALLEQFLLDQKKFHEIIRHKAPSEQRKIDRMLRIIDQAGK